METKTLLFTLLSATVTLQGIGAEKNQDQRPNILFILADDLGKGDLACFGNTIVKTPNLDRLAKNGILMNHYRAAAPICGPSRVSILTGRYSERSGYRMAPTIMDVAGVAPKGKKFDGVSYLAALEGKSAAPAPIRTWCFNKVYLTDISNAALIDGNWKLHRPRIGELNRLDNKGKIIQNVTPEKWQLFDLSNDPFEKTDLASSQPERIKKMSLVFETWWKEVLSENVAISGPVK